MPGLGRLLFSHPAVVAPPSALFTSDSLTPNRQSFEGSSGFLVGNFSLQKPLNPHDFLGKALFPSEEKLVMLSRWQNSSCSRTSIASPASCLYPGSEASLVIPWRWSSPSSAAEKNGLRRLRRGVSQPLRQAASTRARSLLRGQTCLSPLSPAPSPVRAVWEREERTVGLAGQQPPLHQAVRLLRGPTLPHDHPQGSGRGTTPRLGCRQGVGQ